MSLRWVWVVSMVLSGVGLLRAQESASRPRGRGEFRLPQPTFQTEHREEAVDVILGRPTLTSAVVSVRVREDSEVRVGWAGGDAGGGFGESRRLRAREPAPFVIAGLPAGAAIAYRVQLRDPAGGGWADAVQGSFRTARRPGESFRFTVQADSHLDPSTSLELYGRSLSNAVAAAPDFHIDLGDTFMTDKYLHHEDALPHYRAQRHWLSRVGRVAPVFLVLGNHDGEGPLRARDPRGGEMAVWANRQRRRNFPNPEPDDFYTAPSWRHPELGCLQSSYAWEWGDALLVALDPFWQSVRGRRDASSGWDWTLGSEQYEWLRDVLKRSRARHTLVFIHHLVGGEGSEARGGAEASRWHEWGGGEPVGGPGFAGRRPGWEAPIHELLRRRGRVVVFHGHDHFYAKQERDGIVYQLLPQPGHHRGSARSAGQYGYHTGTIESGAGILRVGVSPAEVHVQFISSDGRVVTEYRMGE